MSVEAIAEFPNPEREVVFPPVVVSEADEKKKRAQVMKLFSALQSKLASDAPMVLPVLPREDSDSEDSDDE